MLIWVALIWIALNNLLMKKNDKDYAGNKDLDYKIRYANNVRDSFRTVKNVLIVNNNLLDASQWHRLELYAREIEINNKKIEAKRYDLEWFKYGFNPP